MQVALRRKDRGVAEDLRHQLGVAGSVEQVRDERVASESARRRASGRAKVAR